MKANLVYFDRWMDPIGPEIINASGSFEMTKLSFKDAPEIKPPQFPQSVVSTSELFYIANSVLLCVKLGYI